MARPVSEAELHDLLDREHGALLAGRSDVLERLAAEKERLREALAASPPLPDGPALRAKAERNGVLLHAMRRGIDEARAGIETMRRGPATLHTYDAAGKRTALNAGGPAGPRRV